jgi:hypothetical protein
MGLTGERQAIRSPYNALKFIRRDEDKEDRAVAL